jgi:GT2 family glycosyltransferase
LNSLKKNPPAFFPQIFDVPEKPSKIDMSVQPDLTITVVSWNTRELLRACLASIFACPSRCAFEVHVVDNASADGSAGMVQAEFSQVRLITNDDNLGFARGNNQSWARAEGRYWMLLNSDAEVRPGAIDALVDFMDCHPGAGLTTARLVNPDGSPQYCAQPEPSILRTLLEASRLHKLLTPAVRGRFFLSSYYSYDRAVQLGWAWGTALIARREAIIEAGPLREDFFMYGEDLEWCLRFRGKGWHIWYCPDAEVLHHGARSSEMLWGETDRMRVMLDAAYRAIEIHKGRRYTRLLQASALLGVAMEWVRARLLGRPIAGTAFLLDYYRRALNPIAAES